MSSPSNQEKARRIRRLMETDGPAVHENTQLFNRARYRAVGEMDRYEELKTEARRIKEEAIGRLPELLDRLEHTVREHGGVVHWASDAAEARQQLRSIVRTHEVKVVCKSKSMTSEELELNEALGAEGVTVWETDLGEFVLQVADEAPSHLIGPAIHRSREAIAELFRHRFDLEEPLRTAEELTRFARSYLGERIRRSDCALTGANFLVAETGTGVLVTSEGNARKSIASSRLHVMVSGVEKVLPRFEDLLPFLRLIGPSGTGQDLTSYLSFYTPPSSAPVVDSRGVERPLAQSRGEREFHLILVDNGRLDLREDPQLRETLYCIRCGACANTCANFQQVGGHAFGGKTYTGGIAAGWETAVHGLESTAEFNDLCTGCSRCVEACPVKIDIPWINNVVRNRLNHQSGMEGLRSLAPGLLPDGEPSGTPLEKRFFGHLPRLLQGVQKWIPGGAAWLDRPIVRRLLERWVGLDPRRQLPELAEQSLVAWSNERSVPHEPTRRRVMLYPDPYTNVLYPARGRAAVRVLEALGFAVDLLPNPPTSGRAPLSQGMIRTAQRRANRLWDRLEDPLQSGMELVVIEPTDLAMFQRDYERLLPEGPCQRLRDQSFELMEFLHQTVDRSELQSRLPAGNGRGVFYHGHCQQRTMNRTGFTVDLLRSLGYEVRTSTVECCGMAGSFGYKSAYYDLSQRVGQELAEESEQGKAGERLLASGVSCVEQLRALTDRPVSHPVHLLDPRGDDAGPGSRDGV